MVLAKFSFIKIIVIFVIITVAGCANKTLEEDRGEKNVYAKSIEEVLKEHTDDLMALPGVVGTAQGLCDEKPCIKVYVVDMTPELDKKIPKTLDGFAVSVEVTGEFKARKQN